MSNKLTIHNPSFQIPPLAQYVHQKVLKKIHSYIFADKILGLYPFVMGGALFAIFSLLGMAAGSGLNLAIANPSAPGIMDLAASRDALIGNDPDLRRYLARFTPAQAARTAAPPRSAISPWRRRPGSRLPAPWW